MSSANFIHYFFRFHALKNSFMFLTCFLYIEEEISIQILHKHKELIIIQSLFQKLLLFFAFYFQKYCKYINLFNWSLLELLVMSLSLSDLHLVEILGHQMLIGGS